LSARRQCQQCQCRQCQCRHGPNKRCLWPHCEQLVLGRVTSSFALLFFSAASVPSMHWCCCRGCQMLGFHQGCQIVYFSDQKILIWVYFGEPWNGKCCYMYILVVST
jgi:hypothetical protein